MKQSLRAFIFLFFCLSFCQQFLFADAFGKKVMVVTADPHATRAALSVLRRGGNAVDAAIAAQWVLNVVEPESSGIGGGGFFLYYEASSKRIYAFDGREKAPSKAYPEMFLDAKGNPYTFWPDRITGGLSVGVPGTLRLLHEVHSRFGSKNIPFADLFDSAIDIAESGFPISKRLSKFIEEEKGRLGLFDASKKIFLDEKGNALREGALLIQPDLAKTFRLIKQQGISVFYEGEIAQALVDAVRHAPVHPGLMEKQDLLYYNIAARDPVYGNYRGYDLFSMGPPSSGGSTLIETLNILEPYSLKTHGRSPTGFHLMAEAQKLAFQDRNLYLGDPDFVKIPLQDLLSKDFAAERSGKISFEQAIPKKTEPENLFNTHTSHISIVDEEGNMVSFTTTIEYVFGSGMVVPGYGFVLNNELTDFDPVPFIKGEIKKRPKYLFFLRKPKEKKILIANAPGPDKRPRSSMTPTFIFKNGFPILIVGSPGGSKIIGTVLNVIVNGIDFEMGLQDAIESPRMINRDGPIEMELALYRDESLRKDLESRGHEVVLNATIGNVQAISFDHDKDLIVGVSDPRGEGEAQGY